MKNYSDILHKPPSRKSSVENYEMNNFSDILPKLSSRKTSIELRKHSFSQDDVNMSRKEFNWNRDTSFLKTNSVPVELLPSSYSYKFSDFEDMVRFQLRKNLDELLPCCQSEAVLSFTKLKNFILYETNKKLDEYHYFLLGDKYKQGVEASVSTESSPRLSKVMNDIQSLNGAILDIDPSEEQETFIQSNNIREECVYTCHTELEMPEENFQVYKTTKEIDQIMNKVLESDQEAPFGENIRDFFQMVQDKYPKISIPELKKLISVLPDEPMNIQTISDCNLSIDQSESAMNISLEDASMMSIRSETELSRVCRAAHSPQNLNGSMEPLPQFECVKAYEPEYSYNNISTRAYKITDLNLSRSPVICPITTCTKITFISEFTKHIRIDHTNIPFEKIGPNQCKNLFLDPKVNVLRCNKAHVMYLITDKIEGLGSREYRNFLPLLIMSSSVNIIELACSEYKSHSKEVRQSDQNYLMIWATGLTVPELPVSYNVTVYGASKQLPFCHLSNSLYLYSIREPQDAKSLYKSGQVLLLSPQQIRLLTNNGRYMIKLQLAVN